MPSNMTSTAGDHPDGATFVDLSGGCGGLLQAGWRRRMAIEAFDTLGHNLIAGDTPSFDWLEWLPLGPHDDPRNQLICQDMEGLRELTPSSVLAGM